MFNPNNADIAFAFANPPGRTKIYLPKLSINYDIQAGHSIFAHSRPDKIGTPRLLPLDFRNIVNGLSAKNPLKYYALPLLFVLIG